MKDTNQQNLIKLASALFPGITPENVEVKSMCPFRTESFRGLLADFILKLRKNTDCDSSKILAVWMNRVSESAVNILRKYAEEYCQDLHCLLVDKDGRGFVLQSGLGNWHFFPEIASEEAEIAKKKPRGNLFSANNEWFFKVLLLSSLSDQYWGAPVSTDFIRGVGELAELAQKPQSSASRFVQLAESQNYLIRSDLYGMCVQHISALLEEWAYCRRNDPNNYLRVRSLFPGEGGAVVLRRIISRGGCVISGHAGAAALNLNIADLGDRGIIYVKDLADALENYQLAKSEQDEKSLLMIQPKKYDEIYQAAVKPKMGAAIADALQLYLDTCLDPLRGKEQAEYIFYQILLPHWEKRQWL